MYLNSCDENETITVTKCVYNEFLTLTNKHNIYGHSFSTTTIPLPKKTNTLLRHPGCPRCLLSNDAAHKGLVNLKDLESHRPTHGENSQPGISANPKKYSSVKIVCLVFLFFFGWGGGWKAWLVVFFDVFFWKGCLFWLFFFPLGSGKGVGRWCKGFCFVWI